ncbi:17235_t:CDS:2 [Acaulospora morrowiae]|uniref:17235_t:CDS:1 n=1 Tax=Acaulospora morrowiae TaxID=94023 RepID=A0A9N8ZL73_9GLOM|nr:17235_t:CDS:2 [Acaulospora morrowiae]
MPLNKYLIALMVVLCICMFRECSSHGGGPETPNLPANTLENKYHWKCLDASTNPLHLVECNQKPSQISFSLGFLQQSFDKCKRPLKIYGPGNTVLAWNEEDNTLLMNSTQYARNTEWCYGESNYEDSFIIQPYGRTGECLAAPLKEGDPIAVISCIARNDIELMGQAWSFLTTPH